LGACDRPEAKYKGAVAAFTFDGQTDFFPLTNNAPVALSCNSCSSCQSSVNAASSGDVIKLNGSILNASNKPCIDFSLADNNLTFDCDGFQMEGDGIYNDNGSYINMNFYLSSGNQNDPWKRSLKRTAKMLWPPRRLWLSS
jgi:hypothetical protein